METPLSEAPLSEAWYDLLGSIILIVGFASLLANIAMIIVYRRVFNTNKMRVMNLNLISLTASDIGVVSTFPFKIDACFNRSWNHGIKICRTSAFIDGIFAFSQIFILTEIALEKYFVIRSTTVHTPKVRWIILKISIVWVLSTILSGLPYLGFGSPGVIDGIQISCGLNYRDKSPENRAYIFVSFFLGFVVPITIISFCYVAIFRLAKKSLNKKSIKGSISQKQEIKRKKLEYTLAKTTAICVCCFVVSWAPYALVALMGTFGSTDVPAIVETIAAVFAKVSSTLNAVIYFYNHPRFKPLITERRKRSKYQTTIPLTTKHEKINNTININ